MILNAIKSVFERIGHWIQESYCAVGQRVAERLESVSDAMAEKRYLLSVAERAKVYS
jgi:hypothetical protein